MLKLYIHWDGEPAFTKVARFGPGSTVGDLRNQCWEALAAREPAAAAAAASGAGGGPQSLVLVRGPKRRPLPGTATLSDVLSAGDDVFFAVNSTISTPGPGPSSPSSSAGARSSSATAAGGTSIASSTPAPSEPPAIAAGTSAREPGTKKDGASASDNASASAVAGVTSSLKGSDAHGGSGSSSSNSRGSGSSGGKPPANTPAAAVQAAAASTAEKEALLPLVHAFWERAAEAAAQKNFRNASDILEQALLLAPEPSHGAASAAASSASSRSAAAGSSGGGGGSSSSSSSSGSCCAHTETLQRLARVWLAAGNPGRAVRWALRAAEAAPGDPGVLELAGDCLREGGRPREAAVHYQSALEVLEETQELGEGGGGGGGGGGRGAGEEGRDGDKSTEAQLRVRLSLAACLYDIPGSASPPYTNQDLAASLVMAALEADPGCTAALHLYGRIALARGLADDALRVALRLAVVAPQQPSAKALLAACLPDEAACQQLYAELNVPPVPQGEEEEGGGSRSGSSSSSSGSSVSAAAALGFVATAIKDHGKVDSCIALLGRAAALQPSCASYALNHVHALELRQALQPALQAAAAFCARATGPAAQLAGVPLKDLAPLLLGRLPPLHRAADLHWYLASPPPPPPPPAPTTPPAPPVPGADADSASDATQAPAVAAMGMAAAATAATAATAAAAPPSRSVCYSPDQLDALALLFTAAKLLYVGGALGAAAALVAAVEPLRRASAVELHTTLIRNEAAYFGCVQQLLAPPHTPPQPQPQPQPSAGAGAGAAVEGQGAETAAVPTGSAARPLYLCGDSHCLSAAWRHVTLRGERRLLRPLLVTGCKVWHLRPESVFYPKAQFLAAMALLPPGAQVVLVLGEIDCREGLLLAVQKGKYDTVSEGVAATVRIYIDLLKRLLRGDLLDRDNNSSSSSSGNGSSSGTGSRNGSSGSNAPAEVFVHPVPPVLNETRALVTAFAAALRQGLAAAVAAEPQLLAGRLHYLDFFDDLLLLQPGGGSSSNGSDGSSAAVGSGAGEAPADAGAAGAGSGAGARLRPELAFDGTHLSPAYVEVMDAALARVT
ncbi:hypothetical protein HYH02_009515 [Chlamydomonas schloesseri]|uniref:Uncharacterized protein n=1 Tax=Chlamydomonas schloesseri TaxID=2026947 RepID=A0A835TFF2_9CHLO|nr:hypothetical protein HYH02_009515 [Chlamydomonas schloesseri]|eukprot:KAG2443101.1 hypothetical protein HYH02_009515 [Chlamydomonas schloesseri]